MVLGLGLGFGLGFWLGSRIRIRIRIRIRVRVRKTHLFRIMVWQVQFCCNTQQPKGSFFITID